MIGPLSDERLDEMVSKNRRAGTTPNLCERYENDIRDLIVEIKRLRLRNEVLEGKCDRLLDEIKCQSQCRAEVRDQIYDEKDGLQC